MSHLDSAVSKIWKERVANTFAVINIMTKSLRPKQKLLARDWGNGMILFSFDSTTDREWVLRNQPWHFNDTLFAIKPFISFEWPSSIQITTTSFWVRAHDLPMDCRSEEIITAMGSRMLREALEGGFD